MNDSLRKFIAGLLLAVVSVCVVIGGYSLASIEGAAPATVSPTASIQVVQVLPTSFPTIPVITQVPPTATLLASTPVVEVPLPTSTPLPSITPPPTSATCAPPLGWVAVLVQPSDTLATLAQDYQTSPTSIKDGNCLISDQLLSGSVLYLPARPTATSLPCGAPAGWVSYTVVSGDTLYGLSQRYHVTVSDLQIANCLGSSTYIQAGKTIKVPFVVVSSPIPSSTSIPVTPSSTPVAPSVTPVTPVTTPSVTPVTPSVTPVTPATPTDTPVPTELPSPTLSPVPSNTPLP